MKQAAVDATRRATIWASAIAFLALAYATWLPTPWGPAPDWTGATDVTAPMTRLLLFYHPASAWASFVGYLVTFGLSIAYLNERRLRDDTTARAAAEAGFLMNTIALATGTLWGIQEWYKEGRSGLATVYSDPKVLVVVVLWLTFAAYLLLRRLVDGPQRRARLAAVFGILGFLGVPASYLVGQALPTDLHPVIGGPAAKGLHAATISPYESGLLLLSFIAFTLLFVHLFLARLRLARLEDRVDELEETLETPHAQ
ncbi:MAG: cytochrome c biogenesis protein CcsA [bacterium]